MVGKTKAMQRVVKFAISLIDRVQQPGPSEMRYHDGPSFHPFMFSPEILAEGRAQKKPRRGCLGCLWQVPLILALGVVLMMALTAVFYPWAFYLGGTFHIYPYWTGWGRLHAKSGDYVLFVRFEPTTRGSRMIPHSNLTGVAYLCTPRGERLPMHLGGDMRPHLNLSTDGEAIHLYVYYWPLWYGQFTADHRPSLDFRGHWRNPNLVMDDHGSISNAFEPDGSVYRGHDRNRPYSTEIVPVTLVQGPYSDFEAACATVRR